MEDTEVTIVYKFAKAISKMNDKQKNYFLGFAEGMVAVTDTPSEIENESIEILESAAQAQ